MSLGNYDNEIAVVGAMVLSPECIGEVLEWVCADDFRSAMARRCFEVMVGLFENGSPIDEVILADKLENDIGRESARKYVADLLDVTPTSANVIEYCKLVRNESRALDLMRIGQELSEQSVGIKDEWQNLSLETIEKIQAVADKDAHAEFGCGDELAQRFNEEEHEAVENPGSMFCQTGYPYIDGALGGGLVKSGLIILGARPGMGKTTFALNVAENIAKQGKKVLFVSLEMSEHQIMCKRVSMESGVPYTKVLNGKMDAMEQSKVFSCVERLTSRPFLIADKSGMTTADIYTMSQKARDCSAIIIDYFGLIKPKKARANRYEECTEISNDLKAMAKRLKMPIMVLAQLNRENTKSNDKRPHLQHLRDTGSLEQDADTVLFVHRENYYNRDSGTNNTSDDMEVIVEKSRHGKPGTIINTVFDGEHGLVFETSNRVEPTESEDDYI